MSSKCYFIINTKVSDWLHSILIITLMHEVRNVLPKMSAYVLRLAAVGEMEFLLPGTVAKFIIKSSLLLLSFNKVFSARTTAETCTTAHC